MQGYILLWQPLYSHPCLKEGWYSSPPRSPLPHRLRLLATHSHKLFVASSCLTTLTRGRIIWSVRELQRNDTLFCFGQNIGQKLWQHRLTCAFSCVETQRGEIPKDGHKESAAHFAAAISLTFALDPQRNFALIICRPKKETVSHVQSKHISFCHSFEWKVWPVHATVITTWISIDTETQKTEHTSGLLQYK